MSSILFFLIVTPPFISFILIGLIPQIRKRRAASALTSITAIIITTLASTRLLLGGEELHILFEWIPARTLSPIYFGFLVDPLSSVMLFVVSLVSLMVQIYSIGYMGEEEPGSFGRYYAFHSLFAFSMLGFVASSSLLEIYLFWELVGLCSYLLIGFWYSRPQAARAAVKAFWVTRFGDVGFAIGMILLWGATGTFLLPELYARAPQLGTPFLSLCLLLIFFGAMGKSAQFPLHVWLPDAMEGPTPVSALIHAATMVVAGVYLVLRLFPIFELARDVLCFVMWIGVVTALIGAFIALVQEDIKRILAYSTISQIGYMMAAVGAGAKIPSFFHLFTHAFFKSLLFLAAGSVIHAIGTNNIREMGRLARRMPQTTLVFLAGALALSGIFPFSGYFSKDEILIWMEAHGFVVPFVILLAAAFLTPLYMFRAFFLVFLGEREAQGHPHESPAVMTLPMLVLALLAVSAGFPKEAFFDLLGSRMEPHRGSLEHLPTIVSALGVVSAWILYERRWYEPSRIAQSFKPITVALERKLWLDDVYEWAYRRILDGVSFLCGWFDRYIVDGFVNASAWTIRNASTELRGIQTGRIQDYLYGIIAALVLFVWLLMVGLK
jgi:NADH-quinone oxidoreductase subunit L